MEYPLADNEFLDDPMPPSADTVKEGIENADEPDQPAETEPESEVPAGTEPTEERT